MTKHCRHPRRQREQSQPRRHQDTNTPKKTPRTLFVNTLVPWCLGGSTVGGRKSEIRNPKWAGGRRLTDSSDRGRGRGVRRFGASRTGEGGWEALRPLAGGGETRRPKGVHNAPTFHRPPRGPVGGNSKFEMGGWSEIRNPKSEIRDVLSAGCRPLLLTRPGRRRASSAPPPRATAPWLPRCLPAVAPRHRGHGLAIDHEPGSLRGYGAPATEDQAEVLFDSKSSAKTGSAGAATHSKIRMSSNHHP
jgi:hypothetical protein